MSSPTVTLTQGGNVVTIPSPALNSAYEKDTTQKTFRAVGGSRRTYTYGVPRYRLDRTFEALNEAEFQAFADWLVAINWSENKFTYRQRNPGVPGQFLEYANVRIVEEPKIVRKMHNQWDVTLKLEFPYLPVPANATVV